MFLRRILLILLLFVVILEVVVRLTGVLKTYAESNYGYFINPFGQVYDSHYWLWPPNEPVSIYNTEFTYEYQTNSLGLVDDELDTANAASTISFIGDSFTHGQGAPQDSSMPRLFENLLQKDHPDLAVLNGGIPSGDLFYYTKLVEEVLMPAGYSDFVFVMNTSDIYDFMWLGGRERFQEDGTTVTRKSPWYMGLYKNSHLFRAFFHGILGFDHSYISKNRSLELKEESIAEFIDEFNRIKQSSQQSETSIMVMIHPVARYFSARNKSYVRDYAYLEGMADALLSKGFKVVNLQQPMNQVLSPGNYLEYSWELDKHYNSRGNEVFAESAFDLITTEYPEFLTGPDETAADSLTTSSQSQP